MHLLRKIILAAGSALSAADMAAVSIVEESIMKLVRKAILAAALAISMTGFSGVTNAAHAAS